MKLPKQHLHQEITDPENSEINADITRKSWRHFIPKITRDYRYKLLRSPLFDPYFKMWDPDAPDPSPLPEEFGLETEYLTTEAFRRSMSIDAGTRKDLVATAHAHAPKIAGLSLTPSPSGENGNGANAPLPEAKKRL